ncbi:MAG: putative iron-regulated membrane protein [Halioglobus sp.]|jgi:uncharacterized iron-regulated membrane protein
MTLVLVTGTVATVSHEIDWLLNSDMRTTPGPEKVSWGTMEQAIRHHSPNDQLVSLTAMGSDYFAYRARIIDSTGRHAFVHVDQWRGQVLGVSSTLTVQRFFRDLHRYLFMPNYIGLPIVTSLAFILAISTYTGLMTTRKWRRMATRVRTHRGVRVAVGDAHKAVGLWSVWFMALMIITGTWYLLEFGASVALLLTKPESPLLTKTTIESSTQHGPHVDADILVASAERVFPELEPMTLYFSREGTKPAQVHGQFANPLLRDRANKVLINPVSGAVISVRRAEQMHWAVFLNEIADPLHFGNFGGLVTKLIWFAFGVGLSGLSISGVWLSWQRLGSRAPSSIQYATVPVIIAMLVACFFWYARITGSNEAYIAQPKIASTLCMQ